MDVYEAVQKRKSVRAYEQKPIPKETLDKVLEAAVVSPSANNRQPWHFIIVTDPEKKKVLSKGLYAKFVHEAPTVIVACGDEKVSPKWYAVDTAIALQSIVLVATGEGLGTCWVGSFDEEDVRKLLNIPNHLRIIALLPIGFPLDKIDLVRTLNHAMRKRKSLNEIVSQEKYRANYQ